MTQYVKCLPISILVNKWIY